MRALVQRVSRASVRVEGETLGEIGRGLLVFLGVSREDTEEDARYLADKVMNLRIFPNEAGRFQHSSLEIGGQFLVVSQFTLYADTRRGRRPDFTAAAAPRQAEARYDSFVQLLRQGGARVETGRFQAMMAVELVNDGPVTLLLDSADRHRPRRA